jgi:hypothetical protein
MVENLAESPGMCLDGPGSAPIEIPKRETFSLRGSKKERKKIKILGSGWGKRSPAWFHPRGLGPTRARHARTVCDVPVDGSRGARTVQTQGADGPLLLPERPVLHLFPTSRANGLRCSGGQSARSRGTVRPIAADGPTSPFNFSLI